MGSRSPLPLAQHPDPGTFPSCRPALFQHIRQAPIVPETVDARDVIAILRDSAVHTGLVYDEYGVFQGIVTSADILESIAEMKYYRENFLKL